jgi:hypothetical protein
MIYWSMTEFDHWLKKHRQHFRGYAPDEIAFIARLAGFELSEVCRGVSDQVSHIKRLFTFWESPLMGQWLRLTSYERGKDED